MNRRQFFVRSAAGALASAYNASLLYDASVTTALAQTTPPTVAPPTTGGFKLQYELDVPTNETAQKMFDELAYQRAVQVYLWGLPAVGMQQYRVANAKAMGGGTDDYKLGYLGDLLKSNIEHLTGNPDSMYIDYMFDTHNGPIIAEVPSTLPGFIDDMWELPVVDVIPKVSPIGKYLIVPPGWKGEAPKNHLVARPNTYVSWMLLRGNVEQTAQGPNTRAAVNEMITKLKIYPLSAAGNPSARPKLQYFNVGPNDRPHPARGVRLLPTVGRSCHERAADAD
jgi:hypothetical protein